MPCKFRKCIWGSQTASKKKKCKSPTQCQEFVCMNRSLTPLSSHRKHPYTVRAYKGITSVPQHQRQYTYGSQADSAPEKHVNLCTCISLKSSVLCAGNTSLLLDSAFLLLPSWRHCIKFLECFERQFGSDADGFILLVLLSVMVSNMSFFNFFLRRAPVCHENCICTS
jgi:hypothetical protein